jgi:hypothetical protein
MRRRLDLGLLALSLGVALAGCAPRTAQVSGKVTFKDKPLPAGTVIFTSDDGKRVDTSEIAEDGSYTMAHAPVGPVKISVQTHRPPTIGLAKAPVMHMGDNVGKVEDKVGKYVAIPPKYAEPADSGLTFTVQPGPQTHDITLTP